MTYRVVGRVAYFDDLVVVVESPPLVNEDATGVFPYGMAVEVLLPVALLPSESIQEAWEENGQWVVVETVAPLQVMPAEYEYRAACQALTLRPMTPADVAELRGVRRDRKMARKAARLAHHSGQ